MGQVFQCLKDMVVRICQRRQVASLLEPPRKAAAAQKGRGSVAACTRSIRIETVKQDGRRDQMHAPSAATD
jgi:hypothetical protein